MAWNLHFIFLTKSSAASAAWSHEEISRSWNARSVFTSSTLFHQTQVYVLLHFGCRLFNFSTCLKIVFNTQLYDTAQLFHFLVVSTFMECFFTHRPSLRRPLSSPSTCSHSFHYHGKLHKNGAGVPLFTK